MKKLLLAFMAMTLFACSSEDAPVTTPPVEENPNPENPNPENPNPENPDPVEQCLTYQGGLWLKNQAEVDAFANGPYCKIKGELYIGQSGETMSDIHDISGLADIVVVTESVGVINCPELVSLTGLQNIAGLKKMTVQRCNALVNLSGFPSMTSDCEILIKFNAGLTSLEGAVLTSCKNLSIQVNPELTTLQALHTLTNVKNLRVVNNEKIVNMQGLEGITNIRGSLWIVGNVAMTSLQGLENITHLQSLHLDSNLELASVEHLHNLTAIGNYASNAETEQPFMSINFSESLTSLHGLENLSSFGGIPYIEMKYDANLSDYCALTNLLTTNPSITGVLTYANAYITNADGIRDGHCSQP